ncbi:MAG: alpha-E domain-containing protein [Deltaproteobacteria bacterium]|nr:alpha-E domain-containing protein [Deltaproteobacteria bacterium]
MLGRTASDLFWLSRYVERAESMARLIEVGYRIALRPREGDGHHEEWRSTLTAAGCESGYSQKHASLEARHVVNYMLFEPDNPSSVCSCLARARQNARAQRTAMTAEMWQSLNQMWIDFKDVRPEVGEGNELPELLGWVKQRSALFRGTLLNTILRNDTFYFNQLGTFTERAENTARILNVKYYVLLPQNEIVGGGTDNHQWSAILRSVSAHRSYRWVYKESYRPARIAEYLILNRQMPRSLMSCYDEITSALDDLGRLYGNSAHCHALAEDTRSCLASGQIGPIFQCGLHEFLLDFIRRNHALSDAISRDYHFFE